MIFSLILNKTRVYLSSTFPDGKKKKKRQTARGKDINVNYSPGKVVSGNTSAEITKEEERISGTDGAQPSRSGSGELLCGTVTITMPGCN